MDFIDDNTRRQQMESSNFILKKRRMRILSIVFFLSFLAGKFDAFEKILLTEPIMKKLEHAHFFLDGKIAIF